jgi:hypothetical protein
MMKWFMVKSFFLAALMFLSVLFGMQVANDGIHRMKGYDDPGLRSAFTLQENEGGKFQGSILGRDVSSHDLAKKKQELEKMKAFNLFSSVGKKLADGVSAATDGTIEFILKKVTQ